MAERPESRLGRGAVPIVLVAAAAVMLLYAAYAARHAVSVIWNGEKAAGDVVEIIAINDGEGRLSGYAPSISYADQRGQRYTFTAPHASYPPAHAIGDRVLVYYDREDPTRAALSDFYVFWLVPFLAAACGGLLLLSAGLAASGQQGGTAERRSTDGVLSPSPVVLQFHPLNPVAFKHYLAHAAQPSSVAKVQISEAAAALQEGRHPVVLAQFLASMCVLAGHEEAVAHISANLPHLKSARTFGPKGARGLMFLFEQTAFIVLPSSVKGGPLRWLRHLASLRTAGRRYVPAETVWDAAARSRSLARWWDGLRDEVEAWAGDEALKRDVLRPFVFAGHAVGGGLAVLAAYEFKKRGRSVAAVLTFGAPQPGGAKFVDEYHRLGLDERTDNLVYAARSPLMTQWPLLYRTAGNTWLFDQKPLTARTFSDSPQNDGQGLATFVLDALRMDERPDATPQRPWRRRILLALGAFFPRSRAAIAAHEISRIYALSLDILAYRRLRELIAPSGSAEELAAAAKALSGHLLYLRGASRDTTARPFRQLEGLPVTIDGAGDLAELTAQVPGALI